ncbi:MAG: DNA replication and repair protein RecF, partial [Actinomyces sp.]
GLAGVRAEHDKILAQRASLLKSARAARSSTASMLSTLEVWDAQLAAAAARLIAARVDVVRRLRPWVASAYETVSGTSGQRSRAQIAYRSSLLTHEGHPEPDPHDESAWLAGEETLLDETTVATRLENAMGELHAREIDRGANLVGAHRDDLSLFLAGLPARGFASHGEQWSLALALRLASYDMLRTDVDAYGGDGEPVLILDDVFASLDEQRRRALAQMVAGAQQVLLTAAVDDDVPAELAGARYRVADGEVTRG